MRNNENNDIENFQLGDLPLWNNPEAIQILNSICEKFSIPVDVLSELVVVQRERQHQEKARGIGPRFEEILGRIDLPEKN